MTWEKKKRSLVMWYMVCFLKQGYKNPKRKVSKKSLCVPKNNIKINQWLKLLNLSQSAGISKNILYCIIWNIFYINYWLMN